MITTQQAHKSKPEFVLVCDTLTPGLFTLSFDPSVEDRLCDHQTGRHVAGMVLVEAARQAAAVELERMFPELSESHAAVLSSIGATFNGYCFIGLSTTLRVLVRIPVTEGSRVDTHIHVAIRQGESHAADVQLRIGLMPKAVLRRCERVAHLRASSK